jgi:hypothetical protein
MRGREPDRPWSCWRPVLHLRATYGAFSDRIPVLSSRIAENDSHRRGQGSEQFRARGLFLPGERHAKAGQTGGAPQARKRRRQHA